ncbi:MAG: imidazole glycerol phosphate synthase subunit HisH [Oscillospiraceae bacterium]|nr:imidazole glycerol phosphate synthase subunit HisH [Oscillospiraceae bacterium]
MIAIIDYGAGNIFSVKNALDYLGYESVLTKSADEIKRADAIILPGVGAFPWAMKMLNESGFVPLIREQTKIKPFLGICLGMQLIFDKGYEFEETEGLGLIGGTVEKLEREDMIIPHMGWNELVIQNDCPLLKGLPENPYVYFVHSFAAKCDDKNISAYCDYGGKVTALVHDGKNVFGAQFHPEKSGEVGLQILRNFAELSKN